MQKSILIISFSNYIILMFNWNDLHSFLVLSRTSTLIQASKKLKIEPTTIARRISRLEKSLKSDLFYKSPKGLFSFRIGTKFIKIC